MLWYRVLLCIATILLCTPAQAGWVSVTDANPPPGAFISGQDANGQPVYLCRARYQNALYPGTVVTQPHGCKISDAGTEYAVRPYEILIDNGYRWVSSYDGEIPFDALPAGQEPDGQALFVCRGEVESVWVPGRIRRPFVGCSVAHAGKELTTPWYEVLVGDQ